MGLAKMKTEGRQHGMVRTYRILPKPLNPIPDTEFINRFDSPVTAGLFTQVSSKPNEHSNFAGKGSQPQCNGCHSHPTSKAKDKTKGNQKMKSRDVVSNHKLLDFRVMDARPGFNFFGFSFSGVSAIWILDQLSSYHGNDDDEDEF